MAGKKRTRKKKREKKTTIINDAFSPHIIIYMEINYGNRKCLYDTRF